MAQFITGIEMGLERVLNRDVLERHLDGLMALDPRLAPVREMAGEVPLRIRESGFAGMAHIITSQLLSVASANAIHGRFEALLGEVHAPGFLAIDEEQIRACGISGGKYRTMRAVAEAELDGSLDYDVLADLPVEEAMAALTRLKGIGPWTAEIYLLFCVGHADVFPAGDLVLQKMVGQALGHDERPNEKAVRLIAGAWAPYRGVAARLLWRYFAAQNEKEGVSL
jgi:DNA-3-methyladenine glycosylase II